MEDAFYKVTRQKTLEKAWHKVKSDAESSRSRETKRELVDFIAKGYSAIQSIQQRLRYGSFEFQPQTGVRKKRPGKRFRPIVVAPIENRIVSRAILDTLQQFPAVLRINDVPTSFGGISSTASAIRMVSDAIGDGKKWFVRSDIPDFFTKIPRGLVKEFVFSATRDAKFTDIFDRATGVELENAAKLGSDIKYFPGVSEGVPQGSSLSTLAGNIVLEKFDAEMNSRGIVCIRYIDDFIILGSFEKKAAKAFEAAVAVLGELGMTAYSPDDRPDKASSGPVAAGFDFLGCSITPGTIQPSRANRKKVKSKFRSILNDGLSSLADAKNEPGSKKKRYAQTVVEADNYLQGWAYSFSFCSDVQSFKDIDRELDLEHRRFSSRAKKIISTVSNTRRRELVGIRSVAAIVANTKAPNTGGLSRA